MAAEPSEPAAVALVSGAPRIKTLTIRLDDGTVIRRDGSSSMPQVLKPAEAWQAGMLTEDHLLRMQALLCEVHAKLPEEGPLKSVTLGSKRSLDSVLEVNQTVSKKSMSTGGFQANANGNSFGAAPTMSTEVAAAAGDWVIIAKKLVGYLMRQVLGASAYIFENDPRAVADDYLQVNETPMWFGLISERLESGYYTGPEGFYNDVLLLVDNCYAYNVVKYRSGVGDVGVNLENAFLKAWSRTPMAAAVPPRPLRPLPPPMLHQPQGQAQQARSRPAKKPASQRAPRPRGGGGGFRGRPGRPPGAVARTKSVNSYGAMGGAPQQQIDWTQQMQDSLIAALNTPAILEANLQEVINILNAANEMGVDEDGEASLDLEKITPPTARKLYDLVVGRAPGGLRLDEEDDDYDPEEEDE